MKTNRLELRASGDRNQGGRRDALRRLAAVEGAEVEIASGRERRAAAEALYMLVDDGHFALHAASVDRLDDASAV
jgi:hypothetical protein